jgi:hypothetical protein
MTQKRYERRKKEGERKEGHKSNKKDEHFIFTPINGGDIVKEDTKMT